jgi:hypothetical protein
MILMVCSGVVAVSEVKTGLSSQMGVSVMLPGRVMQMKEIKLGYYTPGILLVTIRSSYFFVKILYLLLSLCKIFDKLMAFFCCL